MLVVRREHDKRLRKLAARVERRERVMQHVASGDASVLLGHRRAGTAAGARTGNQGKEAGSHRTDAAKSK
ncbi:hypothetical protein PBS_46800 [Paraburkholderia sp. 2C]